MANLSKELSQFRFIFIQNILWPTKKKNKKLWSVLIEYFVFSICPTIKTKLPLKFQSIREKITILLLENDFIFLNDNSEDKSIGETVYFLLQIE